jgi:DNA-binding response OmpR family regulator
MPLLDGRALCSKLKKFPVTQGVKIVMVTGKTSQYDRLVGLEVGADDYLEKPAYPQQLARSVKSLTGIA